MASEYKGPTPPTDLPEVGDERLEAAVEDPHQDRQLLRLRQLEADLKAAHDRLATMRSQWEREVSTLLQRNKMLQDNLDQAHRTAINLHNGIDQGAQLRVDHANRQRDLAEERHLLAEQRLRVVEQERDTARRLLDQLQSELGRRPQPNEPREEPKDPLDKRFQLLEVD